MLLERPKHLKRKVTLQPPEMHKTQVKPHNRICTRQPSCSTGLPSVCTQSQEDPFSSATAHMPSVLFHPPNTSPVESSALEVDGGQEQQHACVIRLLPPQLHAVALSCLKIPWLILPVRQLSQPLEGKHTFCWFWSTNISQGGGKRHVRGDGKN